MQAVAGAHAPALHCAQTPSTARAQGLYVRAAGSNMQPSAGAQGPPKWKHAPAPPDRHVKYAAAPAWNAQLGAGHARSGAATGTTAELEPEPEPEPVAPVAGFRIAARSCLTSVAPPQDVTTSTSAAAAIRNTR